MLSLCLHASLNRSVCYKNEETPQPAFASSAVSQGFGCLAQVRVLAVRVMGLAFLWPSVFCNAALHSDDDLRAPGPSLRHFPRPARDFLCLPSGLQLSRHFETDGDTDFNHADQVRGCACVKRMQRRVQQQQTGRAKQDVKGPPLPDSSPQEGPPLGPPSGGGPGERPLSEWHEFWAVSKRRFYATWAQRATQLVPDDPAISLIEAVSLESLRSLTSLTNHKEARLFLVLSIENTNLRRHSK